MFMNGFSWGVEGVLWRGYLQTTQSPKQWPLWSHCSCIIGLGNPQKKNIQVLYFFERNSEYLLKLTLQLLDKVDSHYPRSSHSIIFNKSWLSDSLWHIVLHDGNTWVDTNASETTDISCSYNGELKQRALLIRNDFAPFFPHPSLQKSRPHITASGSPSSYVSHCDHSLNVLLMVSPRAAEKLCLIWRVRHIYVNGAEGYGASDNELLF